MKDKLIWQRKVLPNNLRVLLYPRKSALTTQIGVVIDYGANLDSDLNSGLAHFLEHMVSEGSDKRIKLSRQIEYLGGVLDCHTNHEYSYSVIDVIPDKIPKGASILSEMLFDPYFELEKIELERKIILNELYDVLDNPNEIIHHMLKNCLYKNHPIHREILGSKESLKTISIDDLIQAHNLYYSLPNMILAITGNFDENDIECILNNFLSKDKSKSKIKKPECIEKGRSKKRYNKLKAGINQTYIGIGTKTVPCKHPESHVLDLISTILGDGYSSRLFIEVREKLGLTYNISSSTHFGLDFGYFDINCTVNPNKVDQTIEVINREVKKLCNERIKEKELKKVKDIIKGELLRIVDSPSSFPEFIASCEIKYETEEAILNYLKKIENTSPKDILEVAEKYLSKDKLSLVTLSPK